MGWREASRALMASGDSEPYVEDEVMEPCRSRGGQNRIDWCITHNAVWPVGADRCEGAQEIHHGPDLSEAELSEDDDKRPDKKE